MIAMNPKTGFYVRIVDNFHDNTRGEAYYIGKFKELNTAKKFCDMFVRDSFEDMRKQFMTSPPLVPDKWTKKLIPLKLNKKNLM